MRLQSRPLRVRGLKRLGLARDRADEVVAPSAGAWIETRRVFSSINFDMSRPLRVRGLKHFIDDNTEGNISSRPLRVRGLKLCPAVRKADGAKSRPLRVRGLKQTIPLDYDIALWVAPSAGAWIETTDYDLHEHPD